MLAKALSASDVEAGLLNLVFDVAGASFSLIAEHLREYLFEFYRPCFGLLGEIRILHAVEDVVGNVEGGAKAVARLFGGVAVATAQATDVLIGAKHGGHHHLVERYAFRCQTVKERVSDFIEKNGGTGNKIRYRIGKTFEVEIGTVTYIHIPIALR